MELGENAGIVLSQKGRERDVPRFIKLVQMLELESESYDEPARLYESLPELIWDEIRKVPALTATALEGDVGAIGEDISERMSDGSASDWILDEDADKA